MLLCSLMLEAILMDYTYLHTHMNNTKYISIQSSALVLQCLLARQTLYAFKYILDESCSQLHCTLHQA